MGAEDEVSSSTACPVWKCVEAAVLVQWRALYVMPFPAPVFLELQPLWLSAL